jgi:hypothetical protein
VIPNLITWGEGALWMPEVEVPDKKFQPEFLDWNSSLIKKSSYLFNQIINWQKLSHLFSPHFISQRLGSYICMQLYQQIPKMLHSKLWLPFWGMEGVRDYWDYELKALLSLSLPLEPCSLPFFALVTFLVGSLHCCPEPASNQALPYLLDKVNLR